MVKKTEELSIVSPQETVDVGAGAVKLSLPGAFSGQNAYRRFLNGSPTESPMGGAKR